MDSPEFSLLQMEPEKVDLALNVLSNLLTLLLGVPALALLLARRRPDE